MVIGGRSGGAPGFGLDGEPGFGLAEVLVAIVVLAVGVMGAVATATLAVRTLASLRIGRAVYVAGAILDSLLQVTLRRRTREFPRHRVAWTVRPEGRVRRIVLDVECLNSPRACSLRLEALHAPPLPRIGGEP